MHGGKENMIFARSKSAAWIAVLCGICVFSSGRVKAQAPPGPLPPSHPLPPPPPAPPPKKKPEVAARKTLAGFWKLNADESDDAQKKLEEARQTRAGSGAGPGGGPGGGSGGSGGRVSIGFPYPGAGGGNGPYGGGGGRGMGGDTGETTEEMRELIRPDYSQNIEVKDAEVDSTDEHENKLVLYTDGRKIQKSKDDSLKQVSARWNGSQLVTDEKGPRGRKMSRTLELSPDGRQFYETWHIENGRTGSVIVIRYVYDASTEYE
jgi:hypothetical protein